MKNRNYVLVAAVVVAVLCSSASALVIDSPTTWSSRTKILEQTDGYVEIVAGGSLTANARVDHDGAEAPEGRVILNGGDFTSTVDYKLPDNATGEDALIWIYDGTFTANVIEIHAARQGKIEIGVNGTLIIQSGYQADYSGQTTSERRDNPATALDDGKIYASTGMDLIVVVDGGMVTVTAEPNETIATDPSPEVGADDVPVDTSLGWTAATCMTSQDIWFTTDPNLVNDPNLYFETAPSEDLIVSSFAGTTVTNDLLNGGDPLESLTTYYWMVVSAGGGGDPCVCPAAYDKIGIPWTFTTIQLAAQITSQPKSEVVPAGVEAVFVVETDQTDSIAWYKVGEVPALVTGGDITIEPIDVDGIGTLRITNPEGNEGEYYCVVYNSIPSELESEHVHLYTEKLLAHWKFENDLTCEVDSLNDGSASPLAASYVSSVDTKVPGDAGQAMDFTTDPNQIVHADTSIGRLPQFSISLWMKASSYDGDAVLFRGDGVPDPDDGSSSIPRGNIALRINDGTEMQYRVWNVTRQTEALPALGQWTHYVAVFDSLAEAAGLTLYINGVDEGFAGMSDGDRLEPVGLDGLSMGAWANGATDGSDPISQAFDGMLDDVRVYNYPLSDLEIASLYTDWVDTTICIGLSEAAQAVDIVQDCEINLADFAALAAQWMECQMVPYCEFDLP